MLNIRRVFCLSFLIWILIFVSDKLFCVTLYFTSIPTIEGNILLAAYTAVSEYDAKDTKSTVPACVSDIEFDDVEEYVDVVPKIFDLI